MYNKLFTKILDSSIWLESIPTRIVWLTFIAVMDEAGYVQFASVANVAHRARVTLPEAEEAIHILENPDPNSSNPDHEGRRIERVPGGWMVLNAAVHREMVTRAVIKEQTRERVRRHREKNGSNADVTQGNEKLTPSDTEAVSKSRKQKQKHEGNGHPKASPETTALLAIAELREAVWTAGYDGTRKINWDKVGEHHREKVRAAFLASGWTLEEFDAGKDFGNSKKFIAVYSV